MCPPLLSMRNREPPLEMQQLGPPAISLYVMRVSVVNPFNVIVPHTFNNMSFVVFTTGIVPIVPFFFNFKIGFILYMSWIDRKYCIKCSPFVS